MGEVWTWALPEVAAVARAVASERRFRDADSVVEAADLVWDDLSGCVAEVAALAAEDGSVPDG